MVLAVVVEDGRKARDARDERRPLREHHTLTVHVHPDLRPRARVRIPRGSGSRPAERDGGVTSGAAPSPGTPRWRPRPGDRRAGRRRTPASRPARRRGSALLRSFQSGASRIDPIEHEPAEPRVVLGQVVDGRWLGPPRAGRPRGGRSRGPASHSTLNENGATARTGSKPAGRSSGRPGHRPAAACTMEWSPWRFTGQRPAPADRGASSRPSRWGPHPLAATMRQRSDRSRRRSGCSTPGEAGRPPPSANRTKSVR